MGNVTPPAVLFPQLFSFKRFFQTNRNQGDFYYWHIRNNKKNSRVRREALFERKPSRGARPVNLITLCRARHSRQFTVYFRFASNGGRIKRRKSGYTVKKVSDFPVISRDVIFQTLPGRIFPARESLVNDIPDGDGKIAKLFLQCTSSII